MSLTRVVFRRPALSMASIAVPRATTGFIGVRYNSTIKTKIEAIGQTQVGEAVQNQVEDAVSAVQTAVEPGTVGYFQSLGLAESWVWPSGLFEHLAELTNVYTGLPWWATIAAVTVGFRGLLFPLYLKASDASARMQKVKPQVDKLMADFNQTKDPIQGQRLILQRREIMKSAGVRTSHLMLPIVTLPVFIGVFRGLNRMAEAGISGFEEQGLGWFSNLAAADPYCGLQIITAATYALTFKLGGETGATNMSPALKKVFTWMPFVAIPMTMYLPAVTCFYFAINGSLSLIQSRLLQSPTFRKMAGLAPMVKMDPAQLQNQANSIRELFRKQVENATSRSEKYKREAEEQERLRLLQKRTQESQYAVIKKNKKHL